MTNKKTTVGIFHRDKIIRLCFMSVLKDEFNCVELEHWDDVGKCVSDVLVIAGPELLCSKMPFNWIKERIEEFHPSILLINYDDSQWQVLRSNFKQLRNPPTQQVINNIKKLAS